MHNLEKRGVLLLFFDTPMITGIEKKRYREFHKYLLSQGFIKLQKSVYILLLINMESARQKVKDIKDNVPENSSVMALALSLNKFKSINVLSGKSIDFNLFSDDIVVI